MSRSKVFRPTVLAAVVLAGALVAGANAAGTFVEPGVHVLYELDGASHSSSYGWAVSDLRDVNHDGVTDVIVGEPFNGPDLVTGSTYVYSGRTGAQLYRYDGSAGDWNGFAMADAGDTNGDGVHDFLVGSPGNGPGHADLYSGRTGELLHRFTGTTDGATFGWSVSSAGDVDRDGRADVLVGASGFPAGSGTGYVDVYSGRTYELIRRLPGEVDGDQFGSGVGSTRDVNRDGVADQIVGARHAGPERRGRVYVYSGKSGARLFTIEAGPNGQQFGSFFVAGVGDVNRDGTPDIYAADYSDRTNGADPANFTASGRAGVYSGRDGHELLSWVGPDPDAGLGPGRGAGDVNHDGHPDVIVGSYSSNAGATNAGRVQIFSGKDGSVLRTITSTTTNEQFGFDATGIGDVNGDGTPDALVAAATGDHVYVIAGERSPGRGAGR